MLRICVPQKLGDIGHRFMYCIETQLGQLLLYFTVKLFILLDKCEPEAKLWFLMNLRKL